MLYVYNTDQYLITMSPAGVLKIESVCGRFVCLRLAQSQSFNLLADFKRFGLQGLDLLGLLRVILIISEKLISLCPIHDRL